VNSRVEYTETARRDLQKIGAYIRDNAGEAVAERFIRRVIARIDGLAFMPRRCRVRDELQPGIRAVSLDKYIIFYRVTDDSVFVLRVLHSARNITSELFSD
jgi:toxin ParE1/3/4